MPSLMDIGKSAINAQRQALNVTGQNIANVNTEGYRRRDADLKEVSGSQGDLASKSAQIGLGVTLGEVRRAFNSFLAQSHNSAESKFQTASNFVESLERLENIILPTEGDLASQLTNFFAKLSDISANPGDLAPRAAAIETGSSLSNAFNMTSQLILQLREQLRLAVNEEVNSLNRLTESLALVNGKLRASNIGSAPPLALLDERDRLISAISQKALVNVEYGSRFEASLTLGRYSKGPKLISGDKSVPISVTHDDVSGSSFQLGNGLVFKGFDDGSIKGFSDSLNQVASAVERLDILAIRFVEEINALHTRGIDYDGEPGKELFTAKHFEVIEADKNSKDLDITLLQVPGKIDSFSDMSFNYRAATDEWVATSKEGNIAGTGRQEIDLGGMIVKVSGRAKAGDAFKVSRVTGEAGRIEFLLLDGREIAAASNFVISPASTNTGSAKLDSRPITATSPNLDNILEITTNSISPVSFTEFRSGGAVGYVPAEVKSMELASFGQSPVVELNFSSDDGLGKFSVEFDGTIHTFPSAATKDVLIPPNDVGEPSFNLSSEDIAKNLNMGAIKSETGLSFKELGLHAAAFEGGLKFTGRKPFTSGELTTRTGTSSTAAVFNSSESSSFRVFTREGRQIAGQPMSSSEASALLNEENGFEKDATYRADYLNSIGGKGYRGSEIKNLTPGGYFSAASVTSLINNGNLTSLVKQNPALNDFAAQTVTVKTTDELINSQINLQSGASAKDNVQALNAALTAEGFIANAKTIASLELDNAASDNGRISFDLELESGQFININIDYSDRDLGSLLSQINKHTETTGIYAEVSNEGSRVLLIDEEGNDINLISSDNTLNVNVLNQSYEKLIANNVALNKKTKIVGTIEIRSPREYSFDTSLGGSALALNNALLSGGIDREFSSAGSIADFEWQISQSLLKPQSSPDGSRLASSNATFNLKAGLNSENTGLDVSLNVSDLTDFSSAGISKSLISRARSLGTVPSLMSSVIADFPPNGSSMSFGVGGSLYEVTYLDGKLSVRGPEEQRVVASLDSVSAGYQISLDVPAGTMSGKTVKILNDTDASKFGLAKDDAASKTILRGRTFDLASAGAFTKSFEVKVGATSVTVDVNFDGSQYSVTSNNAILQFLSSDPSAGSLSSITIDPAVNTPIISLVTAQTNGPISIVPSTTAKELGFQVANFDFELNQEGFRVISSNSDAVDVDLDVTGLPGQILYMDELPPEDLIIVFDKEGARRLAASYETGRTDDEKNIKRDYRFEMTDQASGRIELIDNASGHSIATRFTSGVTEIDIDGYRMTLSGFADQHDYFDIALGQSKAGDSRNADALIALSKNSEERISFQEDFRNIALSVGSKLASGRLTEVSATSMRDAARGVEDEMSGVNLDEEASRLMEQQQAYKAAAQILQASRQMFETLVGIM